MPAGAYRDVPKIRAILRCSYLDLDLYTSLKIQVRRLRVEPESLVFIIGHCVGVVDVYGIPGIVRDTVVCSSGRVKM